MSNTPQVNFFIPQTEHARQNKKIILTFVTIWAVAVFGFQFLLMLLNTPTPEENYTKFEQLWPEVQVENPSDANLQDFSKVVLSVLGKNIALKPEHKSTLSEALCWNVNSILPDTQKESFISFAKGNDGSSRNTEVIANVTQALNLKPEGFEKLMINLLPTSLISQNPAELSLTVMTDLPGIMKLYLVHNQNFFTDFKFMGFPFHYWYTAQFLLLLFVGLCLSYVILIEKLNKEHNLVEDE